MFWGILFIAMGVGWILQYYGVLPADLNLFWPVLFIVLGFSIILGKKRRWSGCGWSNKDNN